MRIFLTPFVALYPYQRIDNKHGRAGEQIDTNSLFVWLVFGIPKHMCAHMLIVVAFLVVNIFSCLTIAS